MSLEIMIGVPTNPFPESVAEEIAAVIRLFPEIAFAFLPKLYIPNQMVEPSPVLVLVTNVDGDRLDGVIERIRVAISEVVPNDFVLDMLPIKPDHELVTPTIETGCLIEINDHKVFKTCHGSA